MNNIIEIEGDLFDALDGAVLIHACNCQGSWGKGIAEAFRARYPAAYRIYRAHCQTLLNNPAQGSNPEDSSTPRRMPEGTALLIPPQEEDYQPSLSQSSFSSRGRGRGGRGGGGRGRGRGRGLGTGLSSPPQPTETKKHWIACLFTSWHYGPRNRSPPATILANTEMAVQDLKEQLGGQSVGNGGDEDKPGPLFSCQINAGLFAVPWEQTREVLAKSGLEMTIISPPGQ